MIFSAAVLAGAYRGKNIRDRVLLNHATSDVPLSVGRFRRVAGEALCSKNLDLVDAGAWSSFGDITCQRCLEILARWAA